MDQDALAGQVDREAPPSGPGCVECLADDGWWVHLRRCAACGHVGCCDDSLRRHATAHAQATGHRFIQSFEPGEDWVWDYQASALVRGGLTLAPPASHPVDQPSPGPRGAVPEDWRKQLEERNLREARA
ncbi:UBP-type zinc finger domain-containing protein [Microbacterium sp. BK668]|uniref:UBP-type zinc finger domain-containing protein n=1 Tax=Microbacterium sp. BK668 TaxID=2512118 RepID=UPI0010DC01C0|nr:UBP-type zinc finger domain-containing protein [Microbacterium sp. BK668]TDN91635.1 ubiquitin-hydrolase Zn-finger-containing protein [Microbacterium sp. BK668]